MITAMTGERTKIKTFCGIMDYIHCGKISYFFHENESFQLESLLLPPTLPLLLVLF